MHLDIFLMWKKYFCHIIDKFSIFIILYLTLLVHTIVSSRLFSWTKNEKQHCHFSRSIHPSISLVNLLIVFFNQFNPTAINVLMLLRLILFDLRLKQLTDFNNKGKLLSLRGLCCFLGAFHKRDFLL